jgi:hypothetical protein
MLVGYDIMSRLNDFWPAYDHQGASECKRWGRSGLLYLCHVFVENGMIFNYA